MKKAVCAVLAFLTPVALSCAQAESPAQKTAEGRVASATCAMGKGRSLPSGEAQLGPKATAEKLLALYNGQASSVRTIFAAVHLIQTAAGPFAGVARQYHDVGGLLLAEKPARLRIIGQAPLVAQNLFDLVSDGETLRVSVPPQHKFFVGSANFRRAAQSPVENLRPHDLLDALFWSELPVDATARLADPNATAKQYVLTLLRNESTREAIARKIWFAQRDLNIARVQVYGPGDVLVSDVRYSDWQPAAPPATPKETGSADGCYPRHIWLSRPQESYQLEILITRMTLNDDIPAARFQLQRPAGAEVVILDEVAPQPPRSHPR